MPLIVNQASDPVDDDVPLQRVVVAYAGSDGELECPDVSSKTDTVFVRPASFVTYGE